MNEKIKKQFYIKATIVYLLALSYPIYFILDILMFKSELFKLVITLISLIGILIIIIFIDLKLHNKKFQSIVDWIIYRIFFPWFQLLIIMLILLNILKIIEPTYLNNYLPLIVFICWFIPMLFVFTILRNIYFLVKKIKEMADEDDLFRLSLVSFSFITLSVAFFAPDLAFGVGYQLFFQIFYDEKLKLWDVYYLSMIITNTLPVSEPYINYIENIGKNVYMSTFQIFNVFISKMVNWIVIGLILNYLFLIINNIKKST